jgi:DNA polymerase-3 subunit delta
MPELNYAAFEGENLKGQGISALTAAVLSLPFMAEKRVVKVTDWYPTDSEYEKFLKPTFENFPKDTVLIIVNHGSKKTGCDLKRKKCVCYVDCNKSDEETVIKWVYLTFKRAGIQADMAACTAVAEYCLLDMARVSAEVNKLIVYKGSGTLTKGEVDELVYKDAAFRMYEMTNALARKNYGQFVSIADELLKKGNDEISLINALFSYFKNLLYCLTSDKSNAELAAELKQKEFGIKRTREAAHVFGEKRLKELLMASYEKLSLIKNGTLTKENAFSLLCAEIFFE